MKEDFIYCIGAGCKRKFKCKRWLGNYSTQYPQVKRIEGIECVEQKGQLVMFETIEDDYFIGVE